MTQPISPRRSSPVGHVGRSSQRALGGLAALAAISVLVIAAFIVPDARGFGTHEQLGLPPCIFFAWTGFPCPACGLTTSFAHTARGELSAALDAHALGPALFLLVVAMVPLGVWASVGAGRALSLRAWPARLGILLAASLLVHWLVRLSAYVP